MIANTLAALTMGYISGFSISILQVAQFHIIVELPLTVDLPKLPFIAVAVFGLCTMIMGAKYGTSLLYSKQISQILKGS